MKTTLLFCIAIVTVVQTTAQLTQLEISQQSYPTPVPFGPITAPQTATLLNNTTGSTFVPYSPPVTVTFSIAAQQYSGLPDIGYGTTGLAFGYSTVPIWYQTALGSASYYTSDPFGVTGTGITADNMGVAIVHNLQPLVAAGSPTNGRYYYGKISITFSRPVTNPVLQITELGGFINSQGFTAELELEPTPGITLTEISGSPVMQVVNNKILNTSTTIHSNAAFAYGSVRASGALVSTLVFDAYLRGDGGGSAWANGREAFMLGVSVDALSATGTIFEDANGLSDHTVNGTGSNAGGLNVVLIDPVTDTVVAVAPVASNGTYTLGTVITGTYTVTVTNHSATVGAPPPAAALPAGWDYTGPSSLSVPIGGAVPNINFGIDQLPNSSPVNYQIPDPVIGQLITLDGNGSNPPAPSGSDPEDGTLGSGDTLIITSLPANASLLYNGVPVTLNQLIPAFNPGLLQVQVTPATSGATALSFGYALKDAAGIQDPTPATYALNWLVPLPVKFESFTLNREGDNVVLDWTVGFDQNNKGFTIQHSSDGVAWTGIGFVKDSVNGSTAAFSFVHQTPGKALHYYRIEQEDLDGAKSYSIVRTINLSGVEMALQITPNPIMNGSAQLYISAAADGNYEVSIFTLNGARVKTMTGIKANQSVPIDLSSLPSGTYLIKVSNDDGRPALSKTIKLSKL